MCLFLIKVRENQGETRITERDHDIKKINNAIINRRKMVRELIKIRTIGIFLILNRNFKFESCLPLPFTNALQRSAQH